MCPVCRARYRGTPECSRCGANLTLLMTLESRAWRLREEARRAIIEGDGGLALALAAQAQQLCHTPAGKHLEALGSWLANDPFSSAATC